MPCFSRRYRNLGLATAVFAGWLAGVSPSSAQSTAGGPKRAACPESDSGLKLPAGFCATIFADGIGHARHLVVAPDGVVYVNTWSGRYYGNDTPHAGGFLVALKDDTGAGKADVIRRFGETAKNGGAGGTGIGLYRGALFAEINDKIVRYSLRAGSIVPTGPAVPVVTGLPLGGDHPMHPFTIDAKGSLYVDVATATNACQEKNRTLEIAGHRAVHGARDARRHLAVRREQSESGILDCATLRYRDTQCGGIRDRCRRTHVRHTTWA